MQVPTLTTSTLLERLLSAPSESEVLEFKHARTTYDFDKLGRYFSALSNEANLCGTDRAWLIFGVRDGDHAVVGSQFRIGGESLRKLKDEVGNHLTPRITFREIHEVDFEGKRVVMFEIPAAPRGIPIAWKGHYYGRDHEATHALALNKLERIRAQAGVTDWSRGICDGASLDDLDPTALALARQSYTTHNLRLAREAELWDDVTFLNKAKLCINGKVTRTAILLLGKPEADHYIAPGQATITWILKDRDGREKDYAHFGTPLLLAVDEVQKKIRNLKFRYIVRETLFPEEVDRYDPFIIREALHNCIAHQDYTLGGRIHVVEFEDDRLIFQNAGSFIPESVENVVLKNAPETRYRNPFLSAAMVNLDMIDTIGSGIRRMFEIQKDKYFPLPDYDLGRQRVQLTVTGKILDIDYARKLARMDGLAMEDIIMLDKLQKGYELSHAEAKQLKRKQLIEGRRPNYYVSSRVAAKTSQKEDYIKLKGFTSSYYKKLVLEYLDTFGEATRQNINDLLLDKLPVNLSEQQKLTKIKNLVYQMAHVDKSIYRTGKGNQRHPVYTKRH